MEKVSKRLYMREHSNIIRKFQGSRSTDKVVENPVFNIEGTNRLIIVTICRIRQRMLSQAWKMFISKIGVKHDYEIDARVILSRKLPDEELRTELEIEVLYKWIEQTKDVDPTGIASTIFHCKKRSSIYNALQQLRLEFYEPGETVLFQGDIPRAEDGHFTIFCGSCEVLQFPDESMPLMKLLYLAKKKKWDDAKKLLNSALVLAKINKASGFGELSTLTGVKRAATIRTDPHGAITEIVVLPKQALLDCLKSRRSDGVEGAAPSEAMDFMRQSGLANRISPKDLVHVAQSMIRRTLMQGEVLYYKGEVVHSLFLVVSGELLLDTGDFMQEGRAQPFINSDPENCYHMSSGSILGDEGVTGQSNRFESTAAVVSDAAVVFEAVGFGMDFLIQKMGALRYCALTYKDKSRWSAPIPFAEEMNLYTYFHSLRKAIAYTHPYRGSRLRIYEEGTEQEFEKLREISNSRGGTGIGANKKKANSGKKKSSSTGNGSSKSNNSNHHGVSKTQSSSSSSPAAKLPSLVHLDATFAYMMRDEQAHNPKHDNTGEFGFIRHLPPVGLHHALEINRVAKRLAQKFVKVHARENICYDQMMKSIVQVKPIPGSEQELEEKKFKKYVAEYKEREAKRQAEVQKELEATERAQRYGASKVVYFDNLSPDASDDEGGGGGGGRLRVHRVNSRQGSPLLGEDRPKSSPGLGIGLLASIGGGDAPPAATAQVAGQEGASVVAATSSESKDDKTAVKRKVWAIEEMTNAEDPSDNSLSRSGSKARLARSASIRAALKNSGSANNLASMLAMGGAPHIEDGDLLQQQGQMTTSATAMTLEDSERAPYETEDFFQKPRIVQYFIWMDHLNRHTYRSLLQQSQATVDHNTKGVNGEELKVTDSTVEELNRIFNRFGLTPTDMNMPWRPGTPRTGLAQYDDQSDEEEGGAVGGKTSAKVRRGEGAAAVGAEDESSKGKGKGKGKEGDGQQSVAPSLASSAIPVLPLRGLADEEQKRRDKGLKFVGKTVLQREGEMAELKVQNKFKTYNPTSWKREIIMKKEKGMNKDTFVQFYRLATPDNRRISGRFHHYPGHHHPDFLSHDQQQAAAGGSPSKNLLAGATGAAAAGGIHRTLSGSLTGRQPSSGRNSRPGTGNKKHLQDGPDIEVGDTESVIEEKRYAFDLMEDLQLHYSDDPEKFMEAVRATEFDIRKRTRINNGWKTRFMRVTEHSGKDAPKQNSGSPKAKAVPIEQCYSKQALLDTAKVIQCANLEKEARIQARNSSSFSRGREEEGVTHLMDMGSVLKEKGLLLREMSGVSNRLGETNDDDDSSALGGRSIRRRVGSKIVDADQEDGFLRILSGGGEEEDDSISHTASILTDMEEDPENATSSDKLRPNRRRSSGKKSTGGVGVEQHQAQQQTQMGQVADGDSLVLGEGASVGEQSSSVLMSPVLVNAASQFTPEAPAPSHLDSSVMSQDTIEAQLQSALSSGKLAAQPAQEQNLEQDQPVQGQEQKDSSSGAGNAATTTAVTTTTTTAAAGMHLNDNHDAAAETPLLGGPPTTTTMTPGPQTRRHHTSEAARATAMARQRVQELKERIREQKPSLALKEFHKYLSTDNNPRKFYEGRKKAAVNSRFALASELLTPSLDIRKASSAEKELFGAPKSKLSEELTLFGALFPNASDRQRAAFIQSRKEAAVKSATKGGPMSGDSVADAVSLTSSDIAGSGVSASKSVEEKEKERAKLSKKETALSPASRIAKGKLAYSVKVPPTGGTSGSHPADGDNGGEEGVEEEDNVGFDDEDDEEEEDEEEESDNKGGSAASGESQDADVLLWQHFTVDEMHKEKSAPHKTLPVLIVKNEGGSSSRRFAVNKSKRWGGGALIQLASEKDEAPIAGPKSYLEICKTIRGRGITDTERKHIMADLKKFRK